MDWNKGLKTLHGFCMLSCFKMKKMKLSFSEDMVMGQFDTADIGQFDT